MPARSHIFYIHAFDDTNSYRQLSTEKRYDAPNVKLSEVNLFMFHFTYSDVYQNIKTHIYNQSTLPLPYSST